MLEIGFGMGQATAQIAATQLQTDYLGVEVHAPGVGALLREIGERGLSNLRIVQHDAVEVLRQMLAPGSLAGVHIFFPDPWHKKRHHKRRLVEPVFVGLLTRALRPGGILRLATDWEAYAVQMLEVCSSTAQLVSLSGDQAFAPRPAFRPATRFERRGARLGHGTWDLAYRKDGAP